MERVSAGVDAGGGVSDAYFINILSIHGGWWRHAVAILAGGCTRMVRVEERPETGRQ